MSFSYLLGFEVFSIISKPCESSQVLFFREQILHLCQYVHPSALHESLQTNATM